MIAHLIAEALLEADVQGFMQSFSKDAALRYEFGPGRGTGVLWVKRWDWEGSYTYIGEIMKHTPQHWLVITVAPKTFYEGNTVAHVRHEYRPPSGSLPSYPTPQAASEKLWELYNQP